MASTIAFAYEQQRVLRKIPRDLVSAGLEKSNPAAWRWVSLAGRGRTGVATGRRVVSKRGAKWSARPNSTRRPAGLKSPSARFRNWRRGGPFRRRGRRRYVLFDQVPKHCREQDGHQLRAPVFQGQSGAQDGEQLRPPVFRGQSLHNCCAERQSLRLCKRCFCSCRRLVSDRVCDGQHLLELSSHHAAESVRRHLILSPVLLFGLLRMRVTN